MKSRGVHAGMGIVSVKRDGRDEKLKLGRGRETKARAYSWWSHFSLHPAMVPCDLHGHLNILFASGVQLVA